LGLEYEIKFILTFVVMVLFLSILLGNANQVGAFNSIISPTTDYSANYSLDYNLTNVTFSQYEDQLKPPDCENLGQIPILSDVGCLALILIWLSGFKGMASDFMWFNYIWIIPLSIIVSIMIARFIRGN